MSIFDEISAIQQWQLRRCAVTEDRLAYCRKWLEDFYPIAYGTTDPSHLVLKHDALNLLKNLVADLSPGWTPPEVPS